MIRTKIHREDFINTTKKKRLQNQPKLAEIEGNKNLFSNLKNDSEKREENFMEKLIFMMFGIHIEHVVPIVININI